MIFYIATDTDGKKHCLTVETEAKKIDKNYQQVDIGNTKPELKALIQDSFDTIHSLRIAGPATAAPVATLPEPAPSGDLEKQRWVRGPKGKNPPRYSTHDQAAVDMGVEFIPVDRAAVIAASANKCPLCFTSEAAARIQERMKTIDGIVELIDETKDVFDIKRFLSAIKDWAGNNAVTLEDLLAD